MTTKTKVEEVYLHINNGGISIGVVEEDYLMLKVEATHFGNTTNLIKVYTDQKSLRAIGEMLIAASEKDYRISDYCKAEHIDRSTAVNISSQDLYR